MDADGDRPRRAGPAILAASSAFGNHLLVEAQKLGGEARTIARVSLVDQEGPLALVEVDDPAFWEDLAPLALAKDAPIEGTLTIHKWQRAGLLDSYPGTVRQVRAGRHGLSQTTLLTLEVATATEGLGEGEVVVADGKVAGLVTGRGGDTFSAIASPVLAQFLEGAAKGDWRPASRGRAFAWQELTNPALREALGSHAGRERRAPDPRRAERQRGRRPLPGRRAARARRGEDRRPGPLRAPALRQDAHGPPLSDGHRPGDTLVAKVLRDGTRLDVPLLLRRMPPEQEKVPPYEFGRGPGYVVVGGLVFQELTRPYLGAWGDWTRRAPPRLLVALDREGAFPDPRRRASCSCRVSCPTPPTSASRTCAT